MSIQLFKWCGTWRHRAGKLTPCSMLTKRTIETASAALPWQLRPSPKYGAWHTQMFFEFLRTHLANLWHRASHSNLTTGDPPDCVSGKRQFEISYDSIDETDILILWHVGCAPDQIPLSWQILFTLPCNFHPRLQRNVIIDPTLNVVSLMRTNPFGMRRFDIL